MSQRPKSAPSSPLILGGVTGVELHCHLCGDILHLFVTNPLEFCLMITSSCFGGFREQLHIHLNLHLYDLVHLDRIASPPALSSTEGTQLFQPLLVRQLQHPLTFPITFLCPCLPSLQSSGLSISRTIYTIQDVGISLFTEAKGFLVSRPLPDDIQYFAGTSKRFRELSVTRLKADLGS